MKRLNLFKYGLTAMMMAFAMTLCYSCSSDDDEETNQEVNPPSNRNYDYDDVLDGHAYLMLAGIRWATENVANEEMAKVQDANYGCYYMQSDAKAVAKSWGGVWILPTIEQWRKLIKECYWEWTNNYKGKKGYIVYKAKKVEDEGKYNNVPGYSPQTDKHIFLPAAGLIYNGDVHGQGNSGYYMSATDNRCLYFIEDKPLAAWCNPLDGLSIRLVTR